MTYKCLVLCIAFAWTGYAQTLYSVPAASKGNSIVLTVANESSTAQAQGLSVQPTGSHPKLVFSPALAAVKTLAAGGTADVAFSFSVDREAKIGVTDTVMFLVTDKLGSSWTKQVLLRYTGPAEYKLYQNFPNPFNPSTTIYYDLPQQSKVRLVVYDVLGREVEKLKDEVQEAGYQQVIFKGTRCATGAYFYHMHAEPVGGGKGYDAVKKMMMVK